MSNNAHTMIGVLNHQMSSLVTDWVHRTKGMSLGIISLLTDDTFRGTMLVPIDTRTMVVLTVSSR